MFAIALQIGLHVSVRQQERIGGPDNGDHGNQLFESGGAARQMELVVCYVAIDIFGDGAGAIGSSANLSLHKRLGEVRQNKRDRAIDCQIGVLIAMQVRPSVVTAMPTRWV